MDFSFVLCFLREKKNFSSSMEKVFLLEEKKSSIALPLLLINHNFLQEEEFFSLLVQHTGLPCVSLVFQKKIFCPVAMGISENGFALLSRLFSLEFMEKYSLFPIFIQEDSQEIFVASAYGYWKKKDIIKELPMGWSIVFFLTPLGQIVKAIDALHRTNREYKYLGHSTLHEKLYNYIVEGIKKGISDIHFHPHEFYTEIFYREDGLLFVVDALHKDQWQSLALQLKVLSNMDVTKTLEPQDGHFSLFLLGRSIDFRLSSHPLLHGESFVLRFLHRKTSCLSLEELGYTKQHQEDLENFVKKPEGLVVFSGPTGSGKTTSLYSLLTFIKEKKLNIMTLEEPIECSLSFLRQSLVHRDSMTFSKGLHSLLRQDPDVIFLGEIRNKESAHMALRAAMTGHLVLTTLHTTEALGVFHRFQEFDICPKFLLEVLHGVVFQRLIRLLCPKCKRKISFHDFFQNTKHYGHRKEITSWLQHHCSISGENFLEKTDDDEKKNKNFFFMEETSGCDFCHYRGYKGRSLVGEVITFDKNFRHYFFHHYNKTCLHWKEFLKTKGQKFIENHGLDLFTSGKTSLEEIQRAMGLSLL